MGLPGDSYSSGVAGGGFGGGLHPAYAAGMIANGVGLGEYIQRAASAVPKHTPLDMIVTHGTATARNACTSSAMSLAPTTTTKPRVQRSRNSWL